MNYYIDEHLKQFAKSLNKEIEKYGHTDDKYLDRQKWQIETLVKLEKQFRKELIRHKWGIPVYRDFIKLICEERKNILAARPFFRERQPVFTNRVSKALRKISPETLSKFHFNFQFIQFVMKSRNWGKDSKIRQLYKQISDLRTEIIEMNMPLAINRTRIFYSRTPPSQLSYMDFVQIASEGLMSAVDKFCLPYSRVFRSVIIGRIVGNFIEEYSETLVHFFPADKRKIYRANKVVRKHKEGLVDFDKLADEINIGAKPEHQTTPSEIADLMSAASLISTESGTDEEILRGGILSKCEAPVSIQPDVIVEYTDSIESLGSAMEQLTILEKKLLKLKGVSFV